MSDFFHTLGVKIVAGISGIFLLFSGSHAVVNPQPSVQTDTTPVVTETRPTSAATVAPQNSSSTTTVVNQYITQPVIERTAGVASANTGIDDKTLTAKLSALKNELLARFSQSSGGGGGSTVYVSQPSGDFVTRDLFTRQTDAIFDSIAKSQRIDQLSGTKLSNITINGVSGLNDADIPDGITASNYLPLSGGTLTGPLYVSSLNASSTSYDGFISTNSTTTNATSTNLFATNLAATNAAMAALNVTSSGSTSSPSLAISDAGGLFRAAANTLGVSNRLHVSNFLTVGPTVFTPAVDAEIRDVNSDGYTELRLADNPVVPNNFFAMYYHNQVAFIENWRSAGTAQLDISPKPQDGSSNAQIDVFGNTITSGTPTFYVHDGSGTSGASHINQALAGKGNSYLNAQAGMLGVGMVSPLATLHVEGVRGATSNELARFTDTSGATTLGLSLGYNSSGSTNAYVYNRYSGGSASAINLGFGSTYGSLIALTLTKDLNAAFGGGGSFVSSVGIGTTTPSALLHIQSGSTDEKERITGNDGTLGLSFGYNDSGSTNAYIYNRYSGGSASAINLGFGSSYAAGNVLTLKQSGTAAFTGSVGIGTTTPQHTLTVDGTRVTNANNTMAGSQFALTSSGLDGLAFRLKGNANGISGQSFVTQILADSQLSNAFEIYTGNSIPLVFGTAASERLRISSSGLVGIATSTPWRTLSVTGTVGFDGLGAITGTNSSLCLSANKEVVYSSNSDSCASSLRSTKHDIQNLNLDTLTIVKTLQPVSFIYNNDGSNTVKYGFIAEDAAAADAHLGTYDQNGKLSGIDDRSFLAVIVRALQGLIQQVAGFADNFFSKHITATNADIDTANINKANIKSANVDQLCAKKSDGTSICITGDQLQNVLNQAGQQPAQQSAPSEPPSQPEVSNPEPQPDATASSTEGAPESPAGTGTTPPADQPQQ